MTRSAVSRETSQGATAPRAATGQQLYSRACYNTNRGLPRWEGITAAQREQALAYQRSLWHSRYAEGRNAARRVANCRPAGSPPYLKAKRCP